MSNDQGLVREISWKDLFPSSVMFRAFRLAIGVRILVLSALAVVGLVAGWRIVGSLFEGSSDERVQQWIEVHGTWPWQMIEADPLVSEWDSSLSIPHTDTTDAKPISRLLLAIPYVGPYLVSGPIVRVWHYISHPFLLLFRAETDIVQLAYLLLCCLWELLVWGLFAGAVTRIAALALTRDESLSMKESVVWASGRWPSFFFAPVLPLLGTLLAFVPLFLLGLLMRANWLLPLAGLAWPLALLAGFFLTIVLVGLMAGWPLLAPTISTEATDAFDALSRSYAYVYQRPLHLLFYFFLATLLGILGALLVDFFATLVVSMAEWGVAWGAGTGRLYELVGSKPIDAGDAEPGPLAALGTMLIGFFDDCVDAVRVGYRFGFFWTASTAAYLLLRRHVDATEMDEVALDDEEDELEGLGPLGAPPTHEPEPSGPSEPTAVDTTKDDSAAGEKAADDAGGG
jgi:hypothetical protein